jgi:hypothetical protein
VPDVAAGEAPQDRGLAVHQRPPSPLDNGIAISMDGRGSWRDNVFVKRLWRSVNYAEVNRRAYDGRRGRPADRAVSGFLQQASGRIRSLVRERRPTLTSIR